MGFDQRPRPKDHPRVRCHGHDLSTMTQCRNWGEWSGPFNINEYTRCNEHRYGFFDFPFAKDTFTEQESSPISRPSDNVDPSSAIGERVRKLEGLISELEEDLSRAARVFRNQQGRIEVLEKDNAQAYQEVQNLKKRVAALEDQHAIN